MLYTYSLPSCAYNLSIGVWPCIRGEAWMIYSGLTEQGLELTPFSQREKKQIRLGTNSRYFPSRCFPLLLQIRSSSKITDAAFER